jgi:hypothetical protein
MFFLDKYSSANQGDADWCGSHLSDVRPVKSKRKRDGFQNAIGGSS